MAKKAVLPGCGWFVCDGYWGRCENEAKWRSGFSSGLCDNCYGRMTNARFPSPGFIQPRFWIWNPPPEVKQIMDYKPKAARRFAPPYESKEQRDLFVWAAAEGQLRRYPQLLLMHAVNRRSFALLEAADINPNFDFVAPNICVPAPTASCGALYIELRPAYAQRRDVKDDDDFLDGLRRCGNVAVTAYGVKEAVAIIERYLNRETSEGNYPRGSR